MKMNMRVPLLCGALFTLALSVYGEPPAAAAPPAPAGSLEPTRFVRFTEDESGAKLQTGVATYENDQGVKVTLIGAIHIGDKDYYEKLNTSFLQYDALLYELVGGPIARREERDAKSNTPNGTATNPHASEQAKAREAAEAAASKRLAWLGTLYSKMKSSLELESQLDIVDYHAANFVHADMSLLEFTRLQNEKNEGFFTLWMKAVKSQMENPQAGANQPGILQILEILTRKDSATELKRLLGRSFDDVESVMTGMESGEGTVILTGRNKKAFEVLDHEIGEGRKNLGIFYGAAHLPDMEGRLLNQGFKRVSYDWFTAWDLPPAPPKPAATPAPARTNTTPPQIPAGVPAVPAVPPAQ